VLVVLIHLEIDAATKEILRIYGLDKSLLKRPCDATDACWQCSRSAAPLKCPLPKRKIRLNPPQYSSLSFRPYQLPSRRNQASKAPPVLSSTSRCLTPKSDICLKSSAPTHKPLPPLLTAHQTTQYSSLAKTGTRHLSRPRP
jgi:hypothetical protein